MLTVGSCRWIVAFLSLGFLSADFWYLPSVLVLCICTCSTFNYLSDQIPVPPGYGFSVFFQHVLEVVTGLVPGQPHLEPPVRHVSRCVYTARSYDRSEVHDVHLGCGVLLKGVLKRIKSVGLNALKYSNMECAYWSRYLIKYIKYFRYL